MQPLTWDDVDRELGGEPRRAWTPAMRDCGWPPTLYLHEREGRRLLRAHCPLCTKASAWSEWVDLADDRPVIGTATAPVGCRCMQWNASTARWVGRVQSAECQRVARRLIREDPLRRFRLDSLTTTDAGDELVIEARRGERVVTAHIARSAIAGVEKPWKGAIEPAVRHIVDALDPPDAP